MRRVNYIDHLLRDLRYAGRNLLRSPSFTLLAVAIMALGIGGNTAVFSLVNQILLHPPGISQPQRIIVLRTRYDELNLDFELASPPALAAASDNSQFHLCRSSCSGTCARGGRVSRVVRRVWGAAGAGTNFFR